MSGIRAQSALAKRLTRSFRVLFVRGDGARRIGRAITALHSQAPLLPILRADRAALPELFHPFHVRLRDIADTIAQGCHPHLAEFCTLSSALTEYMHAFLRKGQEPEQHERDVLQALLVHALLLLPSEECFREWLEPA